MDSHLFDMHTDLDVKLVSALKHFQYELDEELKSILDFWKNNTIDTNGGFIGRIDENNVADLSAPKGGVLNARILWTFSAAYRKNRDIEDLITAESAYRYLKNYMVDDVHGGIYWSVSSSGQPLDDKKQVYAIAFFIYGLSEYYLATGREEALELAKAQYSLLIDKAFDQKATGFYEAFARDWTDIADLRLSAKDANEKKTMNTHLHVIEAFATLYRCWNDEGLAGHIRLLLDNFETKIIDRNSGHLILFLDEDWTAKSDVVSYGHDIEAGWLLLEAAEVLAEKKIIEQMKQISVDLTDAATKGLNNDGSMSYEFEPESEHRIDEKHWWVQAEAMVGYFNAFEITKDPSYLQKSLSVWEFVKNNIKDHKYGEWFWGVNEDGTLMGGQDKVGPWKCPYHNGRACLELITRIEKVLSTDRSNIQ